jgi:hypothetical protein
VLALVTDMAEPIKVKKVKYVESPEPERKVLKRLLKQPSPGSEEEHIPEAKEEEEVEAELAKEIEEGLEEQIETAEPEEVEAEEEREVEAELERELGEPEDIAALEAREAEAPRRLRDVEALKAEVKEKGRLKDVSGESVAEEYVEGKRPPDQPPSRRLLAKIEAEKEAAQARRAIHKLKKEGKFRKLTEAGLFGGSEELASLEETGTIPKNVLTAYKKALDEGHVPTAQELLTVFTIPRPTTLVFTTDYPTSHPWKYPYTESKQPRPGRNLFYPGYDRGVLVSFSQRKGKKLTQKLIGTITAFDVNGLMVRVGETNYYLTYTHKDLQLVKPLTVVIPPAPKIGDVLAAPVSETMRQTIRDEYFYALRAIFPKKRGEVEATKATMKAPKPDFVSWDKYHANKFTEWLYALKVEEWRPNLDREKMANLAKMYYSRQTHIEALYADFVASYGRDPITQDAGEVLATLKNKGKPTAIGAPRATVTLTPLEAYVMMGLERLKGQKLTGNALRTEIIGMLYRYAPTHTQHYDQLYRQIEQAELRKMFAAYVPTKDDMDRFREQVEPAVRADYDHARKLHQQALETTVQEIPAKKEETLQAALTLDDVLLRMEITTLEAKYYELYSANNLKYLEAAVVPLLFLTYPEAAIKGPFVDKPFEYGFEPNFLARQAKFYNAKIRTQEIAITKLYVAPIGVYLPEIFLNQTLSDDMLKTVLALVQEIRWVYIQRLLDIFVHREDPSIKIPPLPPSNILALQQDLQKLLAAGKLVISLQNLCKASTGTGYTEDGKPVPVESLVLCYDKDDKKFSCLSLNQIMDMVASDNYTNPATGKPLPSDFVEKMKVRYIRPDNF